MKQFALVLTWSQLLDPQVEANDRETKDGWSSGVSALNTLCSFIHSRFDNIMEAMHEKPRPAVPQYIPGLTPRTLVFCLLAFASVNVSKNHDLGALKMHGIA